MLVVKTQMILSFSIPRWSVISVHITGSAEIDIDYDKNNMYKKPAYLDLLK